MSKKPELARRLRALSRPLLPTRRPLPAPAYTRKGLRTFFDALGFELEVPREPPSEWTCLLSELGIGAALGKFERGDFFELLSANLCNELFASLELRVPYESTNGLGLELTRPLPAARLRLALRSLLREDLECAANAALVLALLGDKESSPALRNLLTASVYCADEAALQALCVLEDPALPALLTATPFTSDELSGYDLQRLLLIDRFDAWERYLPALEAPRGSRARTVFTALERTLATGDAARLEGLLDLGQGRFYNLLVQFLVGREGLLGPLLETLLAQVENQHPDEAPKLSLAGCLAGLGSDLLEHAEQLLTAEDWTRRMCACTALGEAPELAREAVELLLPRLFDDDSDVQREASLAVLAADPKNALAAQRLPSCLGDRHDFLGRLALRPEVASATPVAILAGSRPPDDSLYELLWTSNTSVNLGFAAYALAEPEHFSRRFAPWTLQTPLLRDTRVGLFLGCLLTAEAPAEAGVRMAVLAPNSSPRPPRGSEQRWAQELTVLLLNAEETSEAQRLLPAVAPWLSSLPSGLRTAAAERVSAPGLATLFGERDAPPPASTSDLAQLLEVVHGKACPNAVPAYLAAHPTHLPSLLLSVGTHGAVRSQCASALASLSDEQALALLPLALADLPYAEQCSELSVPLVTALAPRPWPEGTRDAHAHRLEELGADSETYARLGPLVRALRPAKELPPKRRAAPAEYAGEGPAPFARRSARAPASRLPRPRFTRASFAKYCEETGLPLAHPKSDPAQWSCLLTELGLPLVWASDVRDRWLLLGTPEDFEKALYERLGLRFYAPSTRWELLLSMPFDAAEFPAAVRSLVREAEGDARARAALLAGHLGYTDLVPQLCEGAKSWDPSGRAAAAEALGLLDARQSAQLLAGPWDEDEEVNAARLYALEMLDAWDLVAAQLDTRGEHAAAHLAGALLSARKGDRKALRAVLSEELGDHRIAALMHLRRDGRLARHALEPLLEVLRETAATSGTDDRVGLLAAEALGLCGVAAAEALEPLLSQTEDSTAVYAAIALGVQPALAQRARKGLEGALTQDGRHSHEAALALLGLDPEDLYLQSRLWCQQDFGTEWLARIATREACARWSPWGFCAGVADADEAHLPFLLHAGEEVGPTLSLALALCLPERCAPVFEAAVRCSARYRSLRSAAAAGLLLAGATPQDPARTLTLLATSGDGSTRTAGLELGARSNALLELAFSSDTLAPRAAELLSGARLADLGELQPFASMLFTELAPGSQGEAPLPPEVRFALLLAERTDLVPPSATAELLAALPGPQCAARVLLGNHEEGWRVAARELVARTPAEQHASLRSLARAMLDSAAGLVRERGLCLFLELPAELLAGKERRRLRARLEALQGDAELSEFEREAVEALSAKLDDSEGKR